MRTLYFLGAAALLIASAQGGEHLGDPRPLQPVDTSNLLLFLENNEVDGAYGNVQQIVGSVPEGSFVEVSDPTCPGQGVRVVRYWIGATDQVNSVQASDGSGGYCDTTQERGEDFEHAFVKYYWTTWGMDDERSGLRCTDQGLGSVTLNIPMADPNDPNVMLTELFICRVTTYWADYEDAYYKSTAVLSSGTVVTDLGHPYALAAGGLPVFVKPANVKRNDSFTIGIAPVHTFGCDWVPTSVMKCNADPLTRCTAECYKDENGGCFPDSNDIEYKQLALDELVVQVELSPDMEHPPDIYLYKPHPMFPDGLPDESPQKHSDFDSDQELELRVATYLNPYYPTVVKGDTVDEYLGDILTSLSSDNFNNLDASSSTLVTVLFDDNANANVHGVDAWDSGALQPEDSLSLFRSRFGRSDKTGAVGLGGAGGGTWLFLAVDDCDSASGAGTEIANIQLQYVCKETLFCAQSKQQFSPPPPAGGSASGDPHFVGFLGQLFDYHGAAGAVFNVISTPETQVNALLRPDTFQGLTYMSTVGITTAEGARVRVTAMPDIEELAVEINDVAVHHAEDVMGIKVTSSEDGALVIVKAPEMELELSLHKGQFIDISAVRMDVEPAAMHGVLGNTINLDPDMDEGFVGSDEDYFVSSLWSKDFKHNLFGEHHYSAKKHAAMVGGATKLEAKAVNIDFDAASV